MAVASAPPGHLPSEHLDPTLLSFPSMSGELCTNFSAADLAAIAQPNDAAICFAGTTGTHTLLDLVVNGCTALVPAAQPDGAFGVAKPPGTPPYTLLLNSSHHVASCTDSTQTTITLTDCLAAATYSAAFNYDADRVIPR